MRLCHDVIHQHPRLKLSAKHVSYVRESWRCCFIYRWDAYLVWMWWKGDGTPHNKEAVWGESSGVKCSPEFMSSVVVSTSNSSAGKEGTGRLLGLVSQQVELGQWAPDSSGRHCLKNKRQICTWKLIPEVDLWPLPTPPYKCINTYACTIHMYILIPPHVPGEHTCIHPNLHIYVHQHAHMKWYTRMNPHSLLNLPKQKQVQKEN